MARAKRKPKPITVSNVDKAMAKVLQDGPKSIAELVDGIVDELQVTDNKSNREEIRDTVALLLGIQKYGLTEDGRIELRGSPT